MGMVHIASALLISFTSLIPSGCHKSSPQQNAPTNPVSSASATSTNSAVASAQPAAVRDLGEITLTNHTEMCVRLGEGKNCTLTPRMLDRHNLQITLAFQSKNSTGKTQDLSVTQVVTKNGKPIEVAVGNFNLSLTPHISDN